MRFTLPLPAIDWPALIHAALYLGASIFIALLIHRVVFTLLCRLAGRTETPVDGLVLDQVRLPSRWAMVAIAVSLAAQADGWVDWAWRGVASLVVPALLGWIAYAVVKAFAGTLEYRAEISQNLAAARSRRTRIAILSRTAVVVIVIITVGLMLFSIPAVRQVGVTLMASAGLAALAVGAAAQPALKSLIAGLQMAITEPLRLGDLVVIDGHTGRVEEIRMSFVVVRMWDERAAVVPTSRFLENTFENWSRSSEKLTGAVLLQLDPAAAIDPIREEFERYLRTQPLWDGRIASVMMTDARAGLVELRLAISTACIADLLPLRAAVREHMIDWLRQEQPHALLHAAPAATTAAPAAPAAPAA